MHQISIGRFMFLYIFEDGEVAKSSVPPLHVDMQSIADGLLQVIEFRDGDLKEWDGDGKIIDVREVSPDATNCYHTF